MSLNPEGIWSALEASGAGASLRGQETHPFDVKQERPLSTRDLTRMTNQSLMEMIRTLREELGEGETIRLLDEYSAELGRQTGTRQAHRFPDTTFKTFTGQFRHPRYANAMVLEVVEDTENAFGLKVTECVWAEVSKEAGLDGEIGHAAVCNADYYVPPAFNPRFKMERTKTLMQVHDCCNHRYIQEAE